MSAVETESVERVKGLNGNGEKCVRKCRCPLPENSFVCESLSAETDSVGIWVTLGQLPEQNQLE